jgi:hypothetical protein
VTDGAVKPAAAAAPALRGRGTASRLVQYILLQVLIAILCIVVLRLPLPQPPDRLEVGGFSVNDRGATRAVTLPDFVPSRLSMTEPAIFTGHFAWSARDDGRAWSVYLPRFTNGVVVLVNGIEVLDSRRDPAANRSDRATPEIGLIPASLLRDGDNEVTVQLFVWGPTPASSTGSMPARTKSCALISSGARCCSSHCRSCSRPGRAYWP